MAAKSTPSNYGTVAVTLHWVSALLIIALLFSGFRAGSVTDPVAKASLLAFHAPLGATIFILTLARIAWWWFADTKPDHANGSPEWQIRSAAAVHLLFYIVIIGMSVSGIGMFVLSGAGSMIFADVPGQLPDFQNYLPRIPHGIGARFMVLLLLVHAGAALYHHFIMKDELLKRMWFRKR